MSVKNAVIKSCLINYFGENICFIYPKQKNRSLLFRYIKDNLQPEKLSSDEVITQCANILKKALTKTNFDLEDQFCDETDIKSAFNNMDIPKPIALFLSKLFDCTEQDLQKGTDVEEISQTAKAIRLLRIKSMYQVMYFIKQSGMKKTPLHTLISLFVYNTTKSKNIISTLNRLGLAISYDEVLRIRTRLALYTIKFSESYVPLPSHFETVTLQHHLTILITMRQLLQV